MLEITTWMDDFLLALQKNFSHRVWFVGLQGSYGRGEASDLFQFYNDTKPIKGSLDELLPKIDANAIDRAIKIGTCNIYHGCIHNMLYEKNNEILRGLYKSASFVVQAIAFKETGKYTKHLRNLIEVVNHKEKEIVSTFLTLKNGGEVEFDVMSEDLFSWAKEWIVK